MATQADVDAIIAAIASGTQEVQFADRRRVVYRSVSDMERALATLRIELAATDNPYGNADRGTFSVMSRD